MGRETAKQTGEQIEVRNDDKNGFKRAGASWDFNGDV